MFGVIITVNKPRTSDYAVLEPKTAVTALIAGIEIRVENNRSIPVYLKWRI